MKKQIGLIALTLGFSLAGACSSDDSGDSPASGDGDKTVNGDGDGDGDKTSENIIEMFSWWTGPGEAEALQALIDLHEDLNPGARINNAAVDSGEAVEELLAERLADGEEPPSLYQQNVHDIPDLLDEDPEQFIKLDDLFEKNGWSEAFLPEVMEEITYEGSIYAMPTGVHRENALLYNAAILKTQGIEPPESVADLLAACEKLKTEGITCMATGYQGWILRIMFHSLAMGTLGSEDYVAYFTGQDDSHEDKVVETIATFQTILEDYIDPSFKEDGFGWQEASQALFDGDAAFFFHGDWAAGYVQQLGWEAGIDYGSVGAPGAADGFLFGVDVFAIPKGAPNEAGALSFFETIGSSAGQAAFNNIKGSTPVRLDADVSKLTPVAKAGLEDLNKAKVVMRVPSLTDFDDACLAFGTDYDGDALLKVITDDLYPTP